MAIPAALTARAQDRVGMGGELATLRAEYNKLVTQLRVLTAKLDLDAGVTDANYAALVTAADAASPAIINAVPS